MYSVFNLAFVLAVALVLGGPVLVAPAGSSKLSNQEKDAILAAHNAARQNEVPGNPGDPLRALEWDDGLAAASQTYAETLATTKCTNGDHDPNRGDVGENLYQSMTTDAQASPRIGADAVAAWVAEKADYTYASNACKEGAVCGHYTQVVWRDTTKVGCGRATCTANEAFYTHWVCRYSPAGNVNVETTKPY